MFNKTCTIVYGLWEEMFEKRGAIADAYGCKTVLHMPETPVSREYLSPGLLVLCEEKPDLSGLSFDFPVRVVTYKVAMEMVKIDEENSAGIGG